MLVSSPTRCSDCSISSRTLISFLQSDTASPFPQSMHVSEKIVFVCCYETFHLNEGEISSLPAPGYGGWLSVVSSASSELTCTEKDMFWNCVITSRPCTPGWDSDVPPGCPPSPPPGRRIIPSLTAASPYLLRPALLTRSLTLRTLPPHHSTPTLLTRDAAQVSTQLCGVPGQEGDTPVMY